jgi:hypothetical protein
MWTVRLASLRNAIQEVCGNRVHNFEGQARANTVLYLQVTMRLVRHKGSEAPMVKAIYKSFLFFAFSFVSCQSALGQ